MRSPPESEIKAVPFRGASHAVEKEREANFDCWILSVAHLISDVALFQRAAKEYCKSAAGAGNFGEMEKNVKSFF